jgi:copper chaperone CopZ
MNHAICRIAVCGLFVTFAAVATTAGCASTPASSASKMEENAVNHVVSQADIAATHSKEPLKASGAVLWINGLGCPQCASNIDLQLKRLDGVLVSPADLSTGKVDVSFIGKTKPSPQQLADATTEAGFTLMKIETK